MNVGANNHSPLHSVGHAVLLEFAGFVAEQVAQFGGMLIDVQRITSGHGAQSPGMTKR